MTDQTKDRHYTQGRTLRGTPAVVGWSDAQIAANDREERRRVFANFSLLDGGKDREFIAECRDEADAALIVKALNSHGTRNSGDGASLRARLVALVQTLETEVRLAEEELRFRRDHGQDDEYWTGIARQAYADLHGLKAVLLAEGDPQDGPTA